MCLKRLASLLSICALVVTSSIAVAQTQPTRNGTATRPLNGNGNIRDDVAPAPEPAPLENGYQPSYYPETYDYGTGFPVVEIRAVPPAMVRAAVARAEFRRAQSNLDLLIRQMKIAFERSRDFVAALNDEREAWEDLEAAKRDALQSVFDDPAYQASVSLRRNLSDQIEYRRADGKVRPEEILAMAEVKMGYAATASAMEAAALAASPEVQQARERLRRASARLMELRQQFDSDVRRSNDVLAARRDMQDARIMKLASSVYLTGVIEARGLALDYAYHTRRYDRYKYLNYGYHGAYAYPYNHQIGYPIGWPYR